MTAFPKLDLPIRPPFAPMEAQRADRIPASDDWQFEPKWDERSGEWEAVRPELVCEVEYDYFSQGRFRHGSKFLRWRPDKDRDSCTMEQVMPVKSRGSSLKKLFS